LLITNLSITNFRGIASLSLNLDGRSNLFVGANGAGKTAVLTATAKALGADRRMSRDDFVDPDQPVEITCTLTALGEELAGAFNQQVTFGPAGPTLTLGVHASLDGPEIEVLHGFPMGGWTRARGAQLRKLPVLWLSAERGHKELLALTGVRSLLGGLIRELDLSSELDSAAQAIARAASDLALATPLQQLLVDSSTELSGVLADVPPNAFGLQGGQSQDLLRQLELTLEYGTRRAGLTLQPSGLGQLAIFAVVLVALSRRAGAILLLDEPELSLHPQTQRALVQQVRQSESQALVATHSAHALSRWDLRRITRLEHAVTGTTAHVPAHISDQDERRIARYATADLAEACFARTVVCVEGPGDRLALAAFAETLGVDLDARGVSTIELDGADLFATVRELLGPPGLGLQLLGLCDTDREESWAKVVMGSGVYHGDRASLAQVGVLVLDPDLEGVLVDVLGEQRVEAVIVADGEQRSLEAFRQQPTQAAWSPREQLVRYVKKGKTRWPALLAAEMDVTEVPSVFQELLASV
jgi:putative ATP-dependent endonuclease of OLD family